MSVKMSIQGIGRSGVFTSRFYLLKKTKNALGANYNNFHFLAFLKSFSVEEKWRVSKLLLLFHLISQLQLS